MTNETFIVDQTSPRPLRVYLAGRIAPYESDWRKYVVGDVATYSDYGMVPSWEPTDYSPDQWEWTPRPSRVPGVSVTGPFFIEGEGHDGQHGPHKHGVGIYSAYVHHDVLLPAIRRQRVLDLCKKAIKDSDAVLVWLGRDWAKAFGTLVEIGYAHALGVPVYIASDGGVAWDIWFAAQTATEVIEYVDPKQALEHVAAVAG